jgi:DtxR family transcriptional regulator, Mn-dependent transcriptional regulator
MMNRSTEDYLKSIYHLQSGNDPVATSVLAKRLGIGDGSVTAMVKKLSAKRFIRYEPYRGVTLTETGRRVALKMMRRHRLWEMFLVKFLVYTWDEVHEEAERFEHVISDEMERRLDRILGYPKTDPHGDPIPSAEGKLDLPVYTALGECRVGDRVEILRVSDRDPEILQHAAKLGLALNKKITVREKLQFDGSMVVAIGGKRHFISPAVANSIFVQLI